jgi:hypothetical protein
MPAPDAGAVVTRLTGGVPAPGPAAVTSLARLASGHPAGTLYIYPDHVEAAVRAGAFHVSSPSTRLSGLRSLACARRSSLIN